MNISDYRSELYVNLYRVWLLVDTVALNKKGDKILELKKAALLDYIMKNPRLYRKSQIFLGKLDAHADEKEVLYRTNIQFGENQLIQQFLSSVIALEQMGYIELERKGIEFLLSTTEKKPSFQSDYSESWRTQAILIKGLVPKSINIINSNILGE
jgi:hypothetical protein